MQSNALAELENVQLGKPSEFWSLRHNNPLMIQSWQELAFAFTAWSWMDRELLPPAAPMWKQLWDQALDWPIEDDLAYVEQAVTAWSEYPIWNSSRSMKLIRAMEYAQPRDWSSLITPHELRPQRFAFHLLNAVCFNVDKFPQVQLPNIWSMVLGSALRTDLKEMLAVGLLKSPDHLWLKMLKLDEQSEQAHLVSDAVVCILKETFPHREKWLHDLVYLQESVGEGKLSRATLAGQWDLLLNKNQWEKEMQSYQMIDFSEGSPEFF